MLELLFLLLPAAAYSGWRIGKKRSRVSIYDNLPPPAVLSREQLNTLENHLALGNWFRRKGEVDKAINIHEYLTTSNALSSQEKAVSLLELSRDYMRAGVLDRAEQILLSLVAQNTEVIPSLTHLLEIYQQSKDWLRAIDTAEKLQQISGRDLRQQSANFYCELAESSWLNGNKLDADNYLEQALKFNKNCVRAYMLLGSISLQERQYKQALQAYKKVYQCEPVFLPEIIAPISSCYEHLNDLDGLEKFCQTSLKETSSPSILAIMAKYMAQHKDSKVAKDFVIQQVKLRPNVVALAHLLELLSNDKESCSKETLQLLREVVGAIVANRASYRCEGCGYSARTLQWQCPSCKRFDAIKPIRE